MSRQIRSASEANLTYANACAPLAAALNGDTRGEILDHFFGKKDRDGALAALRRGMRSHSLPTASGVLSLRAIVDSLDARSRREGLHVLHGWDFTAQKRPADIAPVLLLDYCARAGIPGSSARSALAILLDQYFLAVLSLFVVRAWDDGDANENLDLITSLLRDLQGGKGSGHRLVDDAETLLLLAVSYYHPEEHAYDQLLDKLLSLDDTHRLRAALPIAAIFGSHLRWGLHFMYERDVGRMRDDNVVDYPWLLFSLVTLMRAYSRFHESGIHSEERERVVEGVLNGLSADPWAFSGNPPAFLAAHGAAHAELREMLGRHRGDLLMEFEQHRPSSGAYSPLGFDCNFLLNASVAMVVIAQSDAKPHGSLNVLFTRSRAGDPPAESAGPLARRLMEYAKDPQRRDAKGAPLIAYDPFEAMHFFNTTVRTLRIP